MSTSASVFVEGAPVNDQERHDSQGDRLCWSMFVSVTALIGSFLVAGVYLAWTPPIDGAIIPGSFEYFVLSMIGGALSGLPHTLLTPVDLIKCRVQVGEYSGFQEGFASIQREAHGSIPGTALLLVRGWAPTFIGYSIQGALKFSLYEYFKSVFLGAAGSTPVLVVFLAASMVAEFIADVGLSPWEAVKIKFQTTRHYPPKLDVVVPRMYATEGMNSFFKGLVPLWARQVPYTMMKFASFEKIVEFIYAGFVPVSKAAAPRSVQLLVSVVSGCLAGALCALVSHPADTVVSKLNQRADIKGNICAFTAALGCKELWRGLAVRLVMIGTLTAVQWLIYDSFKVAVGLPTTGSSAPRRPNKY